MVSNTGIWVRNEVDDAKMQKIREGGELSLYGQVKAYSNGRLSDVKTIKMFTYRVYNVSDDKPKFLIEKVLDITKTPVNDNAERKVDIKFSDVLWTLDEEMFDFFDEDMENDFRVLNRDVVVD